ncbi:TPA: hypothetical protein N0F65_006493 [Lagenidium giganteum]|uniref:FYVE-type domain-containing protein n=1 Tax=Lagenidium giganteum TaxID=4803 RepID=A0AAV2YT81_9STRA|nr:TPA: hypothetical protein N0F65_006493 [Lagenidium giganteum]
MAMDTAFMLAVQGDWKALLEALRNDKALAHRTDGNGMSVLHWVCLHHDVPTEIVVKIICANPALVAFRNGAGLLPLDLAMQADSGERVLEVLRAASYEEEDEEEEESPVQVMPQASQPVKTPPFRAPPRLRMSLIDQKQLDMLSAAAMPTDDPDLTTSFARLSSRVATTPVQTFQSQLPVQPRTSLKRHNSEKKAPTYHHHHHHHTHDGSGYAPQPHMHRSVSMAEPRSYRDHDLVSCATDDRASVSSIAGFDTGGDGSFIHNRDFARQDDDARAPRSKRASLFPPRWRQAHVCAVCAIGFSMMRRRHHCRNCGHSVCGPHSVHRVALEHFGLMEPQRVCDKCFFAGRHIVPVSGDPLLVGMAEEANDPGCWQKKAIYDQCFDQWYKDVFLQHKANGKIGCQAEYKAYHDCYMSELKKDKHLVDGIKAVMRPDVKERWEAEEQEGEATGGAN